MQEKWHRKTFVLLLKAYYWLYLIFLPDLLYPLPFSWSPARQSRSIAPAYSYIHTQWYLIYIYNYGMGLLELLVYLETKKKQKLIMQYIDFFVHILERQVGLGDMKKIADLSLNTIPPSALLLIVPSSKWYMQYVQEAGMRIISFGSGSAEEKHPDLGSGSDLNSKWKKIYIYISGK